MPLPATAVIEVRTDGADTNGGGFDPAIASAGTDRSQQAAAHASGTNLVVDASTNTDVAPDGYTPTAADIGNYLQIAVGTGWTAGFYRIDSIQSGKWRLHASPAAVGVTGGTWALGGALATLTKAAAVVVAGNTVHAKGGPFPETLTPTTSGTAALPITWIGYGSTRGDGQRVVIQGGGVRAYNLDLGANSVNYNDFYNLDLTGSTSACIGVVNANGNAVFANCAFRTRDPNLSVGYGYGSNFALIGCLIDGRHLGNVFPCYAIQGCEFINGGRISTTQYAPGVGHLVGNLFRGEGVSATAIDVPINTGCGAIVDNVFRGYTSHALNLGADPPIVAGNLFISNGGYGIRYTGAGRIRVLGNAYYGNTSGQRSGNFVIGAPEITLTADPHVSATDLSLNDLAGGGLALRGASYPTTFPAGLTANGRDVGPVQHAHDGWGQIAHDTTPPISGSTNAIEFTGPAGWPRQMRVTSGQAVTVSCKARYDSNYGAGTKPTLEVLDGTDVGVADASDTMVAAADTDETLSLTFTPTATGIVTIRVVSYAATTGKAWFGEVTRE